MLPQKQLLPLTGYVHGGCSPVGMSKSFPTYFAEEVILVDTMICSAGKVGYQVEVAPDRSDRPGGRAGGGPHPAITQKEEDTPMQSHIHVKGARANNLKKY